MAKAKSLTPTGIDALKAGAERYEVSDGGCQGLRLVVHPSKRKSFIVRFRFAGVAKKLTLGSWLNPKVPEPATAPKAGTPLSLQAARQLATTALREAKSGRDPCAAKRQERLATEGDTLANVAAEYLRRKEPGRTDAQLRADLDLLCASPLGRLPLAAVKRSDFVRLFDRIADERGPVRADRVLSATSRLLNWHCTRSDYISPLTRGMRRTSIAARARDRVLSDDELRKVWLAAEQGGVFGAFARFVLLTATRRSEAAACARSELSPDGTVWVIPGARYKTGRDTLVPLSRAAQEIVKAQPVAGDFVFGMTSRRPLTHFSKYKAALDTASGTSGWRLHDLRRTARTLLSRAGVAPDIAEQCLGHALTGIRGTYDRHAYEPEKREAFELLAQQIQRIVHPSDVVVPIRGAKAGRRK
jgi:integrase